MTFVENDDIIHPSSGPTLSVQGIPFFSKPIESFRESFTLNIDLQIERIQGALEQTVLQFQEI